MRIKFLLVSFFIVWMILISRVYMISVNENAYYMQKADRNTIKAEPLKPVRGIIYDRNGTPVAVNRLGFKILITPHLSYKSKQKKLEKIVQDIVINLPMLAAAKIKKNYHKRDSAYRHDYVEVVSFVAYNDMLPRFTNLSMNKDIKIAPTTLRHYPFGKVASHILGYVGRSHTRDGIKKIIGYEGRAGIEKFYNDELQGKLGKRVFQVSAKNKEIKEISKEEPTTNQDMVLNVDIKLQEYISKIFQNI